MLTRLVLPRSRWYRIARLSNEANESSVIPTRMQIQPVERNGKPIEKVSLTRGLAMNKFEKDFFIYPEYSDTDSVTDIDGFTQVLKRSLDIAVDCAGIEKEGSLPEEVRLALQTSAVSSTFVPHEYGGLGMCLKDLSKIYEELSVDWNIFSNVNTLHTASNLIVLYGSEEQKKKYLPLIANGKCRPLISLASVNGCSDMSGEAVGTSASSALLTLEKVPVIGTSNANLAIIFAASTHHASKQRQFSCYLIDRSELDETTSSWKLQRDETIGLKSIDIGKLSLIASVNADSMLGMPDQGIEIASELACSGRLSLAAATVGHARRVLAQLAALCNQTSSNSRDSTMMSSDAGAQRCATALALRLYSLESSLYYLSGLIDEGLPIVADIENALLHRLTRDVLRGCVSAVLEMGGLRATDKDDSFEKNIRDVSTLMALHGEGNTVEQVAMATLASWSSTNHKRITSTLRRLLGNEKTNSDMKNPKLQHFIAEHAHPSLQHACQELEFSMSRVNTVISKMIAEQGKNVEQDYGSLEGLVAVLQNQMCMVAVISRASRSYAIGLRNADIELAWATAIATRLSRANWFELEAMSDYFGLVRFNPSLLNAGRAVFDLGGYVIESPIQRNW